jgi:hypothetical protein
MTGVGTGCALIAAECFLQHGRMFVTRPGNLDAMWQTIVNTLSWNESILAVLLAQLHDEGRAAARTTRKFSMAERSKRGIDSGRSDMTVAEVLESFIVSHAEDGLLSGHPPRGRNGSISEISVQTALRLFCAGLWLIALTNHARWSP